MGWIKYNHIWKAKTITEGPSLKMWWFIQNKKKEKRWIVKNLKQFCEKEAFHINPHNYFYLNDLRQFYQDLISTGRSYPGWVANKPIRHDEIYNCLGTKNLKIFKGYYCKELPYDSKKFINLCKNGMDNTELKTFWNDIDFTF